MRPTLFPSIVLLAAAVAGSGCAPMLIGGAATGVAAAHDRRPVKVVLMDQSLELQIAEALRQESALKGAHLNVTSYNQKVLLTGEVPNREAWHAANRAAKQWKEVRSVHNELAIGEPTSLGERSHDGLITTQVKSALLAVDQPGFDPTRVKVVTERDVVYLMGVVTPAEADEVTDRARRVRGVKKVVRLFEIVDSPR